MTPVEREVLRGRWRKALLDANGDWRFGPSHPSLMLDALLAEVAIWDAGRVWIHEARAIAMRAEEEARDKGDGDDGQ